MNGAENTATRNQESYASSLADFQDEIAIWTESRTRHMTNIVRQVVTGKVLAKADNKPTRRHSEVTA